MENTNNEINITEPMKITNKANNSAILFIKKIFVFAVLQIFINKESYKLI